MSNLEVKTHANIIQSTIVIFLDIDYTLVGDRYTEKFSKQVWNKIKELFPIDKQFYKDSDWNNFQWKVAISYFLDKDSIKHLNDLISRISKKFNVVIVLISEWRRDLSVDELKQIFSIWPFGKYIIDKIKDGFDRGNLIKKWLFANKTKYNVSNYLVIDDDNEDKYKKTCPNNYVNINSSLFNQIYVDKAVQIVFPYEDGENNPYTDINENELQKIHNLIHLIIDIDSNKQILETAEDELIAYIKKNDNCQLNVTNYLITLLRYSICKHKPEDLQLSLPKRMKKYVKTLVTLDWKKYSDSYCSGKLETIIKNHLIPEHQHKIQNYIQYTKHYGKIVDYYQEEQLYEAIKLQIHFDISSLDKIEQANHYLRGYVFRSEEHRSHFMDFINSMLDDSVFDGSWKTLIEACEVGRLHNIINLFPHDEIKTTINLIKNNVIDPNDFDNDQVKDLDDNELKIVESELGSLINTCSHVHNTSVRPGYDLSNLLISRCKINDDCKNMDITKSIMNMAKQLIIKYVKANDHTQSMFVKCLISTIQNIKYNDWKFVLQYINKENITNIKKCMDKADGIYTNDGMLIYHPNQTGLLTYTQSEFIRDRELIYNEIKQLKTIYHEYQTGNKFSLDQSLDLHDKMRNKTQDIRTKINTHCELFNVNATYIEGVYELKYFKPLHLR